MFSFKKISLFLSLNVAMTLPSVSAWAYTPKEGSVSALLSPLIMQSEFQSKSDAINNPYFGGLSLIAQGDVNDSGSLEIGLFHFDKLYYMTSGNLEITEKIELMHITLGYRYWMNSIFSLSLAFSSAYSIGDPQVVSSQFPVGQELKTSAHDTTEYGFDLSLQTELWTNTQSSVIADTRYYYSVTPKESEKANHYLIQIGYKQLIQNKK